MVNLKFFAQEASGADRLLCTMTPNPTVERTCAKSRAVRSLPRWASRFVGVKIRKTLVLCSLVGLAAINASCDLRLSIKPESPEVFIVTYQPWDRLLDEYGPGTENIRARIKAANYVNHEKVWDEAYEEAIPRYLEAKNMIPPQCKSGVVVIHSGEGENGNGWARVRCK